MTKGPVLIELEEGAEPPDVAAAPPVPETGPPVPEGAAMQAAIQFAARRPSRLARWFWTIVTALISTMVSLAAWNYATSLVASHPLLGWAVTILMVAALLLALAIALRELAGFARLRRIDRVHHAAAEALSSGDLAAARDVSARVERLYQGRDDTKWGRKTLAELRGDQLDAEALLALTEREILAPLDAAAQKEVETAARQVATVTALVPLALADVVAALTSNLRMIRRVAEIYGGRSGFFGGWRLTRAVLAHLVATGAVAVGDDMLEPLLGSTILAKLSRRFGEGVVNGALTARVGVAAMEVCRPMPFAAVKPVRARIIVQNALTGLFSRTG